MAMEARLFLGPRDGEKVTIVEPVDTIEIMTDAAMEGGEYDSHIYTRQDPALRSGVYRYTYTGMREK